MKEGQGSRPSLRELASQKVVNLNEFRARREDLRPKKQQVEVKPKPELIGDKIIDINAVREERLERRIAPLLKAYLLMPLTPEERKQAIEIQMKSMGRYASLVLEPRNPIADSDKRSVIDIMAQGRRGRPGAGELLPLQFKEYEQSSSSNSAQGGNEEQAKGWHSQKQEKTKQRGDHELHEESYRFEPEWCNRPHEELVSIVRGFLEQKRQEYDKQGLDFDPAEWIGRIFLPKYSFGFGGSLPAINREALNLERAWDAISLPYIKNSIYRDIVEGILIDDRPRVRTLEPKAVKLLDAMAEACGVANTRGEETVDLLKNVRIAENSKGVIFEGVSWTVREAAVERSKYSWGIDWEEDDRRRPPMLSLSPGLLDLALKMKSFQRPGLSFSEILARLFAELISPHPVLIKDEDK